MNSDLVSDDRATGARAAQMIIAAVRRGCLIAVGIVIGAGLAPLELVAGVVLLMVRTAGGTFGRSDSGDRLLDALVRGAGWRLIRLFGRPARGHPSGDRAAAYLATRFPLALLGVAILGLIGGGTVVAISMIIAAITGGPAIAVDAPAGVVDLRTVAFLVVPGVVLLFIGVQGLAGVLRLEVSLWERAGAPSRTALARRVTELTTARADVLAAVDDERRRIERDLHDGVQQRVVALGLLLGRAKRSDAGQARVLQHQAQQESLLLLEELRDVVWRIFPAALDSQGLEAALENLAERSSLPTLVHTRTPGGMPTAVRTAAYFVASEAVTNAIKHSAATKITIQIDHDHELLTVRIVDDGAGGADDSGPGLSGLARRVAALDGSLRVTSPVGGPTMIEAELPCVS